MKDSINEEVPSGNGPDGKIFSPLITSHAKTGEFYKIFIPNVIFTILTLGIFRFWAKVRNRRYILSRMSIMGDGFEYSGTGGELFKGFLIIFVLIILPFGIIPAFYANTITFTDPETAQMIQGTQAVFFFLLFPVAIIRSYRYLFSRITWRGVKFAQVGATFSYWWRWIGFMLLMPLTLGLIYPKRQVVLSRYLVSNSRFGSQSFQMDVQARKLYPAFLLMLVTMVAFIFIFQFVAGIVIAGSALSALLVSNGTELSIDETQLTPMLVTILAAGVIVTLIMGLCLFTVVSSIYGRKVFNEYISRSCLGACEFKANIGFWEFAQFQFVNTLALHRFIE